MTKADHDMARLDALFDDLAQRPIDPPGADFMARLLADADQEMPSAAPQVAAQIAPTPPQPKGFWARLIDAIGGWPACGGITVAGLAGVWIGMMPPAALSDVTARLTGESLSVTVSSDMSYLAEETGQ